MAHLGVLLLQSTPPVARLGDTLVIKQLAPDRGVLDQILTFSTAFIMLCLVAMVVMLVIAAMKMRGVAQKTTQALNKVYADLGPIIKTAGAIAENVNAMSASIRRDVDKVSNTVTAANDQVRQTIAMTEKRINELNALLSVVQSEAERLFISTASTVRGVQSGAATFGRRGGMDFASDELDVRGADPAEEIEILEEDDGDDGSTEPTPPALTAAPRVRGGPRTRDHRS
jgi:methyl-accepting chemotaxis protein